MFNLQGSEIIIVLLLALVVLGPEKLPDAMRKVGKMYGELRKVSSSFQEEFRKAVDEPVREMRETANLLRDSADFTNLASGGRAEKPHTAEMPAAPPPFVPAPVASAVEPLPEVGREPQGATEAPDDTAPDTGDTTPDDDAGGPRA